MFLINLSFVKTAVVLAISIFVINLWLSLKGYIFTDEAIAAVARKHAVQFNVDGKSSHWVIGIALAIALVLRTVASSPVHNFVIK